MKDRRVKALLDRRYLFIVLSFLAISGCFSSGTKVDQSTVSKFEIGETTKSEVISALGDPNNSTIKSDGTSSITYTYVQAQTKAASFIPYVGLFAGGADLESSNASFFVR